MRRGVDRSPHFACTHTAGWGMCTECPSPLVVCPLIANGSPAFAAPRVIFRYGAPATASAAGGPNGTTKGI
eukprot:scaffold9106_cov118-Isochrysis_galbana.AAC.7